MKFSETEWGKKFVKRAGCIESCMCEKPENIAEVLDETAEYIRKEIEEFYDADTNHIIISNKELNKIFGRDKDATK